MVTSNDINPVYHKGTGLPLHDHQHTKYSHVYTISYVYITLCDCVYVHKAIPILSLHSLHHPYIPSFLIHRIFIIFIPLVAFVSAVARVFGCRLSALTNSAGGG